MKILVTGGPVHAKLDAVKIITNKFKGGLMADLANKLANSGAEITYLTAKGATMPTSIRVNVFYHDGFHDYHKKVLEMAPQFDAVVLGAAVANLIPLEPLTGKFPSHNYKPGDVIPINFTIAKRVIDDVKKVAPKTHLFGFKLLSGVPHKELISAAYGVLLESSATAVFANDATNLAVKYAVTKERGEHEMNMDEMAAFIVGGVQDTYYSTIIGESAPIRDYHHDGDIFALMSKYESEFVAVPEGYVFGTIAVRNPDDSFITTGRGKHELNDLTTVAKVDHDKHIVLVNGVRKASLNAPLLDWIFKTNPNVYAIMHYHRCDNTFITLPYAIPGTVRDSQRNVNQSFNIEGHGCFLLLDKNFNVMV